MRLRGTKLLVGIAAAAAVLAVPAGSAFADSCANVSRAPAPCGWTCTTVVIDGNWVWMPSPVNFGVPAAELPYAWGFSPPGTADSTLLGLPNQYGNYTNGYTSSLLGHSANCPSPVPSRQSTQGIQTGCV
jgi:hypothetical protein